MSSAHDGFVTHHKQLNFFANVPVTFRTCHPGGSHVAKTLVDSENNHSCSSEEAIKWFEQKACLEHDLDQ